MQLKEISSKFDFQMKIKSKSKSKSKDVADEDLYFSGEQDNAAPSTKQNNETNNKRSTRAIVPKKQQPKTQAVKKQVKRQQSTSHHHPSSTSRPKPTPPSTPLKLQPSDIRFIEKIVEQKHGKLLTMEQVLSLKKKMHKETYNQSNPYRELNYNTGERDEWIDCKKKILSEEDKIKLKKHFLKIANMVDKGQQAKYTLRDMAREFNLDQSAYLQMKRIFQMDPDVSIHVRKFANKVDPQKESSQIQNIIKKKYILQKILQKNPLLTKSQIAHKIVRYTKNQAFFPQHEITRLLEQQGFNWRSIVKDPESRNFKENLQRKKVFCQKINYILTETKYHVYFLGLMNFNSFMFRTQGWTKDEYLIEPIIDESFTLVALTQRSGQGTWKFQKQAYKEEVFGQTCRILFDQLIQETFQPKYIAIDFRFYKYQSVLKKSRKKYDVQIIWIPPFSNFLSPLEFWFEDIGKSLSRSKKMLQISEQCNISEQKNQVLIKDIYNDLKTIFTQKYDQNFDFTNFFEMAAKYHKQALEMEKF